jgi:Flp pilus assembly protein TadG
MRLPRPRLPCPRVARSALADDRGALAPFVVLFALTVFVLAGLVVDGGLAISKREQAADIAEQAARFAADKVSEADLRNGIVRIDQDACDTRVGVIVGRHQGEGAALDADAGPACLIDADGESVQVKVKISYQAQLLSLVGVNRFTARAEAVARPAAGIDKEIQ